ncbi:hypothetical protein ACJX0J_042459, partial [Zea mays]
CIVDRIYVAVTNELPMVPLDHQDDCSSLPSARYEDSGARGGPFSFQSEKRTILGDQFAQKKNEHSPHFFQDDTWN